MADLVITPANVVNSGSARTVTGVAGETITAGQPVYVDSNYYYKADSNASALSSSVAGIALNNAYIDQPLVVAISGTITIGATTVKGATYILSSTAGGVCPDADAASGWYKTVLGVAEDVAGVFNINIHNSGITI